MFDHLFTPLTIGTQTLANRICFPAHRTNFCDKGLINDRLIAHYRRRAMGGCGLIILGELSIHPGDRPWAAMIEAHDESCVQELKSLCDAVHEFDTKIFANLNHHGFQSSGAITRQACIGPSATADIAFGETAKPMEPEDVEMVTKAFGDAASLCVSAGFDGLEIDMGPASLLRQFLSPLSNQRQDEYGQSLENRMRFPLMVLNSVREKVGKDVTIGIRICADELFWGALTPEETVQMSEIFEKTGLVDFFNVAVGTYYNLHMQNPSMHVAGEPSKDGIQQIKNAVSIPVIGGYKIASLKNADNMIGNSEADVIGFTRALICDPDMPKKASENKTERIRKCVWDNNGCIGRINQSKILGCIQNPEVGYDHKYEKELPKPEKTKTVWVIGAGPAGLEAARTAGLRGHNVIVYEKESNPGGQVALHSKAAGRQGMKGVIKHLTSELSELDIPIIMDTEVTLDLVKEKSPDAVVVATGSVPVENPVPGEYSQPFVQTVEDILLEKYDVGEKVLLFDENSGHHSTATAEKLADMGKKVDIVTSDLFVGVELANIGDLSLSRGRLLTKGATFTTDTRIEKIEGSSAFAKNIYSNKLIEYNSYDTIVLDLGNKADDDLYFSLKGLVKELYRVGDCVAPRGINMAIIEGRKAGEAI